MFIIPRYFFPFYEIGLFAVIPKDFAARRVRESVVVVALFHKNRFPNAPHQLHAGITIIFPFCTKKTPAGLVTAGVCSEFVIPFG